MEIERKFLIKDLHSLPFSIEAYPHRELEQAYLCTGPVVRNNIFSLINPKGL